MKKFLFLLAFLVIIPACEKNPAAPFTDLSGWWAYADDLMTMNIFLNHDGEKIEGFGWMQTKMWGVYFEIKGEFEYNRVVIQFIPAGFQPFIAQGQVDGDVMNLKLIGSGFNGKPVTFTRTQIPE